MTREKELLALDELVKLEVIDLFSGAGGWAEGLKKLGITSHLGIEWDATIAATANAAGHHTIVGDVAELDPHDFGAPAGMVGSPPCQAYSAAGKRLGRVDRPIVEAAVRELAQGHDTRAERLAQCQDERSLLTAEPMRWAVELRPRWIALEQVPAVLPLWELYAELLRERGYWTDAGHLSAEQFGVPQTRKRAYLIASLDGPVNLPAPTHQKYKPHEPAMLRDGLLPWVSMAQALRWGTEADSFLVVDRSGARANEGHLSSEPAPTLTSRGRRWYWTRPATVMGDPRLSDHELKVRDGVPASTRALRADDWPWKRPATTIAGDARAFPPGGHHTPGAQSHGAIRLAVEEAATLQGFPPDYPWQGSRSKQFLQIGNAVVPRMAELVAGAAAGPTSLRAAA